ncbi:hypothetical protein [Ideonella sp. YS5]|uniref:hypothetical protein n=1 Tax=Ideonella sp. YS5 TaxID=3453714 RepID=UPI003EE8D650
MRCPGISRRGLLILAGTFAGSARAAAPAANFSLQWRVVPWPPAPVASPAPGSVTVSTTGSIASTGDLTTRTATSEPAPQRLLLRNGGQAQITQLRDTANDPPDLVWTPQGQGVESARARAARRGSLWVQVQWPGGHAPATLGYRFEQPLPDSGRADARQQLDGELLIPFDQWVPVGHWAGLDGNGQALELRLSRLP